MKMNLSSTIGRLVAVASLLVLGAAGAKPNKNVCDQYKGTKAFGRCKAFCNSKKCVKQFPDFTSNACQRKYDNFVEETGTNPPCVSTDSPSESPTKSPTDSPTKSPTDSPTKSPSGTDSPTGSPTKSPSKTPSDGPSESPSKSPTKSPTVGHSLTREQAVEALLSDPDVSLDPNSDSMVWSPFVDFGFGTGYEGLLPAGSMVNPAQIGLPPFSASGLTVGVDSYFFWIDDEPDALFQHTTRFVLVDATAENPTNATGEIFVVMQGWWPVITIGGEETEFFATSVERDSDEPAGPFNPDGLVGGLELTPTIPATRFLTSPSVLSSIEPSASPSSTPSASPSFPPSFNPTRGPINPPTSSPTSSPSEHPSVDPSASPSSTPSVSPSTSPTLSPSASPSVAPSAIPSAPPSTSSSASPTAGPSVGPSATPSAPPSASPSASPSSGPSQSPSFPPSQSPSASPSVVPSAIPSASPTTSPSASTTAGPSERPTASPSSTPSASPSASPSQSPSASPSGPPSLSLTASPSASPSAGPSESPSVSPSLVPTVTPSGTGPSAGPTASPNQTPSAFPSPKPSSSPSAAPSASPSLFPSTIPSVSPSSAPSASPSESPSVTPTAIPSASPTSVPSASPSGSPSVAPSASPSTSPSSHPTKGPSDSCGLIIRGSEDPHFGNTVSIFESNLKDVFKIRPERIIKANGGAAASAANIDAAITALLALEDCDEYFVRIASHGSIGSLALAGRTSITKADLDAKLKMIGAKGKKVCLVINSCFSSSLKMDDNFGFPSNSVIITSAAADETSFGSHRPYKMGDCEEKGSLFPIVFSKALLEKDADKNKDKCVDCAEAFQFLIDNKPCWTWTGNNKMRYPAGRPVGVTGGGAANPEIVTVPEEM